METIELVEWIRALIKNNNIKAFYKSGHWQKVRTDALKRDNNECQKCKVKGDYNEAQCVHHKQHVKKRPDLALTLDNVISLCDSCHNEEHPEKFRNKPKPQLNEERW